MSKGSCRAVADVSRQLFGRLRARHDPCNDADGSSARQPSWAGVGAESRAARCGRASTRLQRASMLRQRWSRALAPRRPVPARGSAVWQHWGRRGFKASWYGRMSEGPQNEAMKLTRLSAAPGWFRECQAEGAASCPRRRETAGTASQLIASVRRTPDSAGSIVRSCSLDGMA